MTAGPVHQGVPPPGREHSARGRLVRRSDDDDSGAARVEGRDVDAEIIDGHVHDAQAHRDGRAHRLAVLGAAVARVLEGGAPDPGLGQRPQDEAEPLREPGAHHDQLRISDGRPHPPQVPGDHLAQRGAAARVAVIEVGGRHAAACLPCRPGPVAAREAGQVRDSGAEVRDQPRRRFRALGRRRRRRVGARRDPGGRAKLAGQVALGKQLAVALLHQAAGHAQLMGQLPGRRQPLAIVQPAAPDGRAQAALQLGAQRLAAVPVEPQQQLRTQTGPLNRHDIGPYQCSTSALRSQA